jgi:hypothetical protein
MKPAGDQSGISARAVGSPVFLDREDLLALPVTAPYRTDVTRLCHEPTFARERTWTVALARQIYHSVDRHHGLNSDLHQGLRDVPMSVNTQRKHLRIFASANGGIT